MPKNARAVALISFVEGLLAIIWLASIPGSGNFFSPIRSACLFGILLVSIGWLFISFRGNSSRFIQRLMIWKSNIPAACLCICLPLLVLSAALQHNIWSIFIGEAVFARLLPVLVWASILAIQVGLFILFSEFDPANLVRDLSSLWKPAGLVLACFMLTWAFIATTKIGISSDSIVGLSWGPPGTPITFGQVFLAFTISICLAVLYILYFSKLIRRADLLNAIIFVGLWALAVHLWWQQPMAPSHFAPFPLAPNFEYYPNSDAAVFDKSAYQLLYGAGFQTELVRRPLYVGMLALFHKISGHTYAGTIFPQILTLAFIPALLFLLVMRISNRLAGLLTGGLITLRETNAIQLSGEIAVSHAKLLMSDLMTMLGVLVILWLAMALLTKRDDNPWRLAILGACIGLTTLIRAQTVVLIPPLLLFFLMGRPFKIGVRMSMLILIGFFATLAPWVWRNWNLTGTLVLDDRGEERLLARDYSQNPTVFPTPFASESEKEFSARLQKQIVSYTVSNPKKVLFFVSNHFLHNMADGVLYTAPLYSSASPVELLSQAPFWGAWNGQLTGASRAALLLNLTVIASGIVIAQRQSGGLGTLPLIVFMIYSAGNAIVRSSGWRFFLPVDWVILMYYCIAIAYIPLQIGRWLQRGTLLAATDQTILPAEPALLMPFLFSFLFLLGASIPIAERFIPVRDFETFTTGARETFSRNKTFSSTDIDSFLQEDNAVLFSGIALYPRYVQPNSRIYLADMPTEFKYLHFWLINTGNEQIVLPLQKAPKGIPHTATVSVLGCKQAGYISALAVIIHSQPERVLTRSPRAPLSCPIFEPN